MIKHNVPNQSIQLQVLVMTVVFHILKRSIDTIPSTEIIPPSILDYGYAVRQIVRSLCVGECYRHLDKHLKLPGACPKEPSFHGNSSNFLSN